jgi:predicted HicB family RNase H-like nuclease
MEIVQTTIRLPAEIKEKIQQEADKRGYSLNMMMIIVLQKGLESL